MIEGQLKTSRDGRNPPGMGQIPPGTVEIVPGRVKISMGRLNMPDDWVKTAGGGQICLMDGLKPLGRVRAIAFDKSHKDLTCQSAVWYE